MKTPTVYELSDALVDDLAALRPIQATFMGVAGHDHAWDDLSPTGVERASSALRGWRARLDAIPEGGDRWEKLARHVMDDWLDMELASLAHGDPYSDLNTIASSFQSIRLVFDSMDTASIGGWTNLVARVETVDRVCEGYRASLAEGLRRGAPVAARQVRAAVEQGRVHAGAGSYFRRLPEMFAATGLVDADLRGRLDRAVPGACAAFGALTDWLEAEYLPKARARDGVGRERYAREARRFLGAEIDLDATYAWGWSEVKRLHGEMVRVANDIAPGKSVPDVLTMLRTDPARCEATLEGFLAVMRARQETALRDLDGVHFEIPDVIRRIEVRTAPPGGPLGAYYVPPSEDFSRPGTVWYSRGDGGPFALYDEVSTAYHEGFPGHHLQCGIQVSLTKNLCRLHRVAYGYSGYAEGWALYAEQLMHELGYYERPDYLLGMLANQMMRACRVVFDIGAHLDLPIPDDALFHPGARWGFDLGVEMMSTLGGLSPDHAVSEVNRYLGWPGQAISYKVGQRVMLELRDAYRAQTGDRGSLKDFHRRVLETGNVGLDLLKGLVLDG